MNTKNNIGPSQITDEKGNVYDVIYKINEESTRKNLIDWIALNSSVISFSWWKNYYDFPQAGKETIDEFTRDINNHRIQTKEFLDKISTDYLLKIRDEVEKLELKDVADEILRVLGYEYRAEK